MAFAQLYPLEAFKAVSGVCWWRASDVKDAMRKDYDAFTGSRDEYVVPANLKDALEKAKSEDAADNLILKEGQAVFNSAIEAHLKALSDAGLLGKTDGLKGRGVARAEAWNNFVDGRKEKYSYDWMIQDLGNALVVALVHMDSGRYDRKKQGPLAAHQLPDEEQVIKAWENLCNIFDEGTSQQAYRYLVIEDVQDSKTGDRCQLHFNNWQAQLMVMGPDYRYIPAQDAVKVPLIKASFNVPTGDLLLTDFLRVDGMNEALDFGDQEYSQELSLSSDLGRYNRANAHAEQHDIGYCQTTNTSVAVWRDPATGNLAITERWFGREEDEVDGVTPVKGWEMVGTFGCDMWRITAMDVQTASKLTSPKAVEDYLACDDCYSDNVVRLKVPAGKWTIHAGDNFKKRLPRHRFGLPTGIEIWCVLEAPKAA